MENSYLKKLVKELIDKNKWSEFLRRFIDVLWINNFVVDYDGKIIIPPLQEGGRKRYGSKFLTSSFGFDLRGNREGFIKEFVHYGPYLESKDPFDFRTFAIPIRVGKSDVIAYLCLGPVILNKRWSNDNYLNMANQLNLRTDDLLDSINEIRVVSFVTIKAILDLLSEVTRDIIALNIERKQLYKAKFNKEILPERIAEAAQDLYTTIHLNELLVTILDIALNLTQAECGSIMILNNKSGSLGVKVSRGIDEKKVMDVEVELGEGIAGIAAKENQSFLISANSVDNRIAHLLRRPEIKKSAVIPLMDDEKVIGVLNVHTQRNQNKIEENVENLKYVSKLISAAIRSI